MPTADTMPSELSSIMESYPADLTLSLVEEEEDGKRQLLLHRPLIAMTSAVLRDAMGALSEGESLQVSCKDEALNTVF